MCVVSMIGDHYRDKWTQPQYPASWSYPPQVTQQQFEELKKEVLEMKELLKRALKYDEDNNQPNCEIEQKMDFLRQVAKSVDIDLDDVLGKGKE